MNDEKEISSNLNLLAKSSIIVFCGIFLSKVLAYLYRIIIAREFGPEVYGLYSLAFAIILWVSTVGALGLPEGLLRFISIYRGKKDTDKIRVLMRSSLWIMLFVGIILGAIVFFLSDEIALGLFGDSTLSIYLKIFSISIPIGLLSNIVLSSLMAFEKIGWYSFIFNILQNITRVLVLIFLVFLGMNGTSTAISFLVSICAMLLVGFIVLRIYLKKYLEKPKVKDGSIMREVFSYSFPLMFAGIAGVFLFSIDTFFIGYFMGVKEIGFYNAAVPIASLLAVASEIFIGLFFPLINKAYARKNKKLIEELSKQVSKWIFFINIPAFVLIFLFPGAMINILFGSEYLVAETALQILAVGMFLQAISVVPRSLIAMTGKSKIILSNMIFVGILNAILNVLLIPKFGINGAAIGTSISYGLMSLILFAEAHKYSGVIPLRRKIVPMILSTAAAALSVMFARQFIDRDILGLILLFALFCLVCIVLFILTGSFDKEDKRIINLILNKLRIRK